MKKIFLKLVYQHHQRNIIQGLQINMDRYNEYLKSKYNRVLVISFLII